jgi:hypothetical protein
MMVVVFAIKWSSVLLSAVSTINTSGDGDDLQPQPQHRAAITSHNTLFIFADDQRQPILISASILVSFSITKQKGKKSVQQQKKKGVDIPISYPTLQTPSRRHPARHLTVKMPLRSETSLKCHLHCLGPRAAIAGYPCEWVATARFVLGAAGGILRKWSEGAKISSASESKLTITVENWRTKIRYIYRDLQEGLLSGLGCSLLIDN